MKGQRPNQIQRHIDFTHHLDEILDHLQFHIEHDTGRRVTQRRRDTWVAGIRLLITHDCRTVEDIHCVIDHCHTVGWFADTELGISSVSSKDDHGLRYRWDDLWEEIRDEDVVAS